VSAASKSITRRTKGLTLLIVVIAALGFGAYRYFHRPPAAPLVHYTVSKVTRGDVSKVVMTTGQLAPLVSVEVSTQISGLITDVRVDFNTPVKKGEVLALIDPSIYQQALQQAKANLRSAEASNKLAQLTVDRQRDLSKRSLVAQQDYDQAAALYEQSEAGLLTQRAAVQSAQVDLDRCTLTSPIDGIVIYKSADVGKTVQASFSAPTLFVIARDLRQMQIIADVSEVDIWSVKVGQDVTFTIEALPNRTFHGTLKQIRNPYIPSEKQSNQPQTESNALASFSAVIEVENPDLLLLPSLTANVSIVVLQHRNVLHFPNSALRVQLPPAPGSVPPAATPPAPSEKSASETPEAKPTVVYRLPHGDRTATPECVSVQLGLTDSIVTEVTSGLAEGDLLVTGVSRPPPTYRSSFF
jgi:HlyD family secretion protein